jgi:hypothetical protein
MGPPNRDSAEGYLAFEFTNADRLIDDLFGLSREVSLVLYDPHRGQRLMLGKRTSYTELLRFFERYLDEFSSDYACAPPSPALEQSPEAAPASEPYPEAAPAPEPESPRAPPAPTRANGGGTDSSTSALVEVIVGGSGSIAIGGDAAESTIVIDDAARSGERQINVWLGNDPDDPRASLTKGVATPLSFMVGRPVAGSLTSGPNAAVPDTDVPPGGLKTHWLVMSRDLELAARSADVKVTQRKAGWRASFDLIIPQHGDSEQRQILVTAHGELQVSSTCSSSPAPTSIASSWSRSVSSVQ